MVRVVFGLRKLASMSYEEFDEYWRTHHAPLVRRHAAALRIRRYVQLRPADGPVASALARARGGPDRFDGIAELWFDSVDDLSGRELGADARAAAAALVDDERRFIDLANSPIWVYHDDVIIS